MSPLCRKSNRCAACGAILLHCAVFASLLVGFSMVHNVPDVPAVESMYITLAEPVSAPEQIIEEAPPEETPPDPPEPLPEAVSVTPKPKPKPEKKEPKPQPKPQPVREVVEKAQERQAAPTKAMEPEVDQKSMQNAISALLARLEKEKRYPNSARRLGLEGQSFINVELDSRGGIRSYRLETGDSHPILQKSAMQAMERVCKKWKPVALSRAITVQVPLRFELH